MSSKKTDRRDFLRGEALPPTAGTIGGGPSVHLRNKNIFRASQHPAGHEHHPPRWRISAQRARLARGGRYSEARPTAANSLSGFSARRRRRPVPVVMPDLEKLPWKMIDGV